MDARNAAVPEQLILHRARRAFDVFRRIVAVIAIDGEGDYLYRQPFHHLHGVRVISVENGRIRHLEQTALGSQIVFKRLVIVQMILR